MSKVLLADPIDPLAEQRLCASEEVSRPAGPTAADLCAAARGVDAIIVRTSRLMPEVLSVADRLRVIGKHGVGLDNVDVAYATRRGVVVVHTPAANAVAVTEFTLASIFLLLRPIRAAERALRAGSFADGESLVEQIRQRALVGGEVHGRTVGIVGWGTIGRRVGAAVSALGASVLVFDPLVALEELRASGAGAAHTLDELLATSDIVSLHVPVTPETVGLIGARELGLMQPHALLVNTSRGAIVDEIALADALRVGTIRAAAVDVFTSEPPPPDHPLLKLDNAICTPHVAGATVESLGRMAHEVVEAVLTVLAGGVPSGVVNPEVLGR